MTARDELLLQALARFGIARTSQLVALGFGGVRGDTAARRLRRLYDAGYFDVRCRNRTEQNLYVLGPAGSRWMEARAGRIARCPRGGLDHHLVIIDAWVELVLAVHALPGVVLERARPDWEIRELAGPRVGVVPDLLARIRVDRCDGQAVALSIAVEVDRGTESMRVLRAKLARYTAEWTRGGGPVDGRGQVFVFYSIGGSRDRLACVGQLLSQTWPGRWSTCRPGEFEALLQSAVAGSSAPLTTSPRSKGMGVDLTADPILTRVCPNGGP